MPNTLYDPSVDATLEKVARLVGQYERAVVAVVGHTDSSMKGKGTRYEDVKALSTDRAEARQAGAGQEVQVRTEQVHGRRARPGTSRRTRTIR